jgi:hypothetical protein
VAGSNTEHNRSTRIPSSTTGPLPPGSGKPVTLSPLSAMTSLFPH